MGGVSSIVLLDGSPVKLDLALDERLSISAAARIDARTELIAKLTRPPQTEDDRELILLAYEQWGDDCVKHLIGDFAFAIWDNHSRRLFCARDHFGVKPFFFTRVEDSFLFSTRLNHLRADLRVSETLNETAIGDYLLFGLNQDLATTTFRDIQRLPAAHTLKIENDTIVIRRYWTPGSEVTEQYRDPRLYVERFLELLRCAVSDRLRENRVAVLMSGGLDSTSLAAVAKDCGADVRACAVVYDNLIPDKERYFASAAANHLGIPISYVVGDRYSLFDEQVAGDMDQPEPFILSPQTAEFHTLLRHCAAHSNVALTGYDGDAFMNEPRLSRLKPRTRLKRWLGRTPVIPPLPEWIDESFAKRTNLQERWEAAYSEPAPQTTTRPAAMHALDSKVWAPLFEGYDPGATRLDLEVRHPFSDIRLVEYLLAIPPDPWCVKKHVLRVAMRNRLPVAVLNRRKTPLAGDPALQLVKRGGVRWLDNFEVNPQLDSFVNLNLRRSVADETTSDGLWASLRVYALNYWLANSQPIARRMENQANNNRLYRTSTA